MLWFLFPVDLSLYKDESQIEKKTPGKRKSKNKSDSSSPVAKKRKIDTIANKANTDASSSKSTSILAQVIEKKDSIK